MNVESTPSRRSQIERYPNYTPVFALFVAGPVLLFWLIIRAVSDWMEKTILAGFWRAVFPWLSGCCLVVLLICGAILAWHLYLVWHRMRLHYYDRKAMKQQLLLEAQDREATRQRELERIAIERQREADKIELERQRILLEQMKATLEHERMKQVPTLLNAGQTAIFALDNYRLIQGQPALPPAGRQQKEQLAPYAISQERDGMPDLPMKGAATVQQRSQRLAVGSMRQIEAPDEYDLIEVIRGFPLAEDRLFLGIDQYACSLSCDSRLQLCHGAFNAVTGRGKTILIRGIETQLLKMGHEVVHADIKFSLRDEKGNDYRPIAKALLDQGDLHMAMGRRLPHLVMREDHICSLIEWLAGPELTRRLAMYNRGDHSYDVFYLFLEEMAYLIGKYKDLGPLIAKILVVGRSLGMKVFAVAQNFQVQNLKINSGMRENFESAWFLGGDTNSGGALLDMPEKELRAFLAENNIQLGRGVTLFRNNTVAHEPRLMRAGMASNDFVYWFLGRADGFTLPGEILPVVDSFLQPALDGRSSGGGGRSGGKRDEGTFVGGSRASQSTSQVAESDAVYSDQGRSGNGVDRPVEDVGGALDERPVFPMMNEVQVAQFKAMYPRVGSIDGCLDSIEGCNHRHRQHARLIIEQFGLKRKSS
jgi:hypothetical protein